MIMEQNITVNMIRPYKTKPKFFVSKDGERYDCKKFGYAGTHRGQNSLPKDGLPFTIEYEKWELPLWYRNGLSLTN